MYIQPIEWRMHGILNSQSDAGKFETCAPFNEVKIWWDIRKERKGED